VPRSSVVSRIAHETFAHSPSIMPEGCWWENLESNFSQRPEGFELEPRDWLKVNVTALGDLAIRTAGASLLGVTALPAGLLPFASDCLGIHATESREELQLYMDLAVSDPKGLFDRPSRPIEVTRYSPRRAFFRPKDGRCEGLKFETPYEPYSDSYRKRFARHTRSRVARARHPIFHQVRAIRRRSCSGSHKIRDSLPQSRSPASTNAQRTASKGCTARHINVRVTLRALSSTGSQSKSWKD
jgi:hypothetical protein